MADSPAARLDRVASMTTEETPTMPDPALLPQPGGFEGRREILPPFKTSDPALVKGPDDSINDSITVGVVATPRYLVAPR
jgi:hypothetical protein